jgi:cytochrome bd-type quinol oxidase subunit 1
MDLKALLLSRLQFAFTISFHIIFPSFTIGLAAWLTVLEALHLRTGRPAYRQVFEFWLKVFGVAFGLGVLSGIVMAFQFGTNWSVIALPDEAAETNHYAISIPVLGSLIARMSFDSKEVGLTDFQPQDRPPVIIPFFTFRIMVGCWLILLLVAWVGSDLIHKERIEQSRLLLWLTFLNFLLPFIAILTGWCTAEVGSRPTVYGGLRTADAMTPF